eukprot:Hpha_TRINITY_DN15584_c1_g14::TRINITY_DN15584_c1_g14_i2::g.107514::m.107514
MRRSVWAVRRAVGTRSYYPNTEPVQPHDFDSELRQWGSDAAAKASDIHKLFQRLDPYLTECEDIMSTWRETKWHGRDAPPDLRIACDDFLARKYDRGEEISFLERILLQYRLMVNGRFERAFSGYFRTTSEGVTVLDQEDRWGEVKKLVYTNVPVIHDLYQFQGLSPEGYREALGRMLLRSLKFRLDGSFEPGSSPDRSSEFRKVLFQNVQRMSNENESENDGPIYIHVLASYQDNETIDYVFLHPHPTERGRHRVTLICIGSGNKYKRRSQVPTGSRLEKIARRCESVFGLSPGSVDTRAVMTPPTCLTREALETCDALVGGLDPDYSRWIPYYPLSRAEAQLDVDWKDQAKKQQEDEWYQL